MEASLGRHQKCKICCHGRPRAFLPCCGSSQIPVGWCVRALSALASPRHSACWQELLCSQASVTLFGTVTHELRTHTLTTADLLMCVGPGGVTSRSTCSDVTCVSLNLFVVCVFECAGLQPFSLYNLHQHLPGFV